MASPPLTALVPELRRIISELENQSHQTVANRRKFQFACSQFRQFSDQFASHVTGAQMTQAQLDAYRSVVDIAHEYSALFGQHTIQCWAHSALENHSTSVASELCALATRLQEVTVALDQQASKSFDASSPQWLQYHLLDLRAISASFKQYIQQSTTEDTTTKIMLERQKSIDHFIEQYESEGCAPPGARVFSPIPVYYQSWRMNHTDLDIQKEVGSGVSAVVYYGYDKRTGMEVAIKRLKFKKLTGSKLQAFQRELAILATATYPTLLRFVGATDSPPFCIITQWMSGGSLYHDIHRNHTLDMTKRTIAAYDIARGMQFLHSRQIIHRDLKSLNVLIDGEGLTRICDFGFSRHADKDAVMTKNVGTPHWMAPELLNVQSPYDNKIDVYAYAIVLWELITSQLPYQGMDPTQIVAQVLMNDARPPLPQNLQPALRQLIQDCWARDPNARPSFAEITRRFQEGGIYIEEANPEVVQQYIRDHPPNIDGGNEQSDAIEDKLKSASHDENGVDLIVKSLEGQQVPQHVVDTAWTQLDALDHDTETYAKGCTAFLSTSYSSQASTALRQLKCSVSKELVLKAISIIPTGNDLTDTNLVVFACKNKCAANAVELTVQPLHLELELEVIAVEGLQDESLRDMIIQRCLQVLTYPDPLVICSALRCLVGIKATQKIPLDQIKMHMQSKDQTLKLSALVVAAEMACNGVRLPYDIIDSLTTRWDSDPLAASVIVAGCHDAEIGRHIVNRLAYGSQPPVEVALRILIQASKHPQLKEPILLAISRITSHQNPPEIATAIRNLTASLNK